MYPCGGAALATSRGFWCPFIYKYICIALPVYSFKGNIAIWVFSVSYGIKTDLCISDFLNYR